MGFSDDEKTALHSHLSKEAEILGELRRHEMKTNAFQLLLSRNNGLLHYFAVRMNGKA